MAEIHHLRCPANDPDQMVSIGFGDYKGVRLVSHAIWSRGKAEAKLRLADSAIVIRTCRDHPDDAIALTMQIARKIIDGAEEP